MSNENTIRGATRNTDQAGLTSYIGGLFDGDGNLKLTATKADDYNIGYELEPRLRTELYISGLFDAEGCVKTSVHQKDGYTINHQLEPALNLRQTKQDGPPTHLIVAIRSFCDQVGINTSIKAYEREDDSRRNGIIWRVTGRADVKKAANVLVEHTLVKRAQLRILLDQILPRLEAGVHTDRRGFLRTMAWVDLMNSMKGGTRGKYDVEYFEDEWGMELSPEHDPDLQDVFDDQVIAKGY